MSLLDESLAIYSDPGMRWLMDRVLDILKTWQCLIWKIFKNQACSKTIVGERRQEMAATDVISIALERNCSPIFLRGRVMTPGGRAKFFGFASTQACVKKPWVGRISK